jgi:glycosyltransferase involved in cell wall biosynthesis
MTTKVIYDYQIFAIQEYGGISRYYHEIASRIARMPDFDLEMLCPLYVNEYFEEYSSNQQMRKGWKIKSLPKTYIIKQILNQAVSNLSIDKSGTEIIHETMHTSNRFIGSKKHKRVVTIYDMMDEKFAASRDRNGRLAREKAVAVERADRIICISESTRKDAIELLNIDESKISTIHIAATPDITLGKEDSPGERKVFQIDKPYLLYVGIRGDYKNFTRLVEAYHLSQRLNQDFQLICFGGGAFSADEKLQINSLQLADKVIHISGDDNKLAYLYRRATAFIYPSLYEGFGMPPLEAMAFNCPVICSNVSSIPEVVGDAGEYFDPYNVDSIIDAIEKVVYSETRSNHLRQLGQARTKVFSWDLCAKQTSEVYHSLL